MPWLFLPPFPTRILYSTLALKSINPCCIPPAPAPDPELPAPPPPATIKYSALEFLLIVKLCAVVTSSNTYTS